MGWFYGWDSRQDLVRHLTAETEHLKTHAKYFSGNDLWTVQENKTGQSAYGVPLKTNLFICLYMLRRYVKDDWGYKPVEASCGPTRDSCPLKFLAMVPCSGGYETAWRWRVAQYWRMRRERLKKRRAWRKGLSGAVASIAEQYRNRA